MSATVNTAALFFKQFKSVPVTDPSKALPCTIVDVKDGGFRVDVVVKDPANANNVAGQYVERNVPYVADGTPSPKSGYFVTPADYSEPVSATPPSGVAFVAATTGGTLATGTYGYRISATDAFGETLASAEVTVNVTGPTGAATGTWTNSPGTTGIKVYGRTPGGEQLLATLGAVTTYTDTGAATPSGALPTAGSHQHAAESDEGGSSNAD